MNGWMDGWNNKNTVRDHLGPVSESKKMTKTSGWFDSHCIFIQIFVVGSEKCIYCNRVHNGRSRSPNVIDFGTNRNARVQLPISDLLITNRKLHTQLWSYLVILVPFRRYGGLKVEHRQFVHTKSHLSPSLGVTPFEFCDEPHVCKN